MAIAKGKTIHIETLVVDDKTMKVTYKTTDSKNVQERIKKEYPRAKLSQSGDSVSVEVSR